MRDAVLLSYRLKILGSIWVIEISISYHNGLPCGFTPSQCLKLKESSRSLVSKFKFGEKMLIIKTDSLISYLVS